MKLDTLQSVKTSAEIMKEFNLNPLEELARLSIEAKARGDDMAVESISKFLMPYVYPKQKHVSMDVSQQVTDQELVDRLKRGRERMAKLGHTIEHVPELDHKEVSFL